MRMNVGARGAVGLVLLGALAAGWTLWETGAFAQIGHWASERQRDFQNAMAGAVSALRRGEASAFWTLIAVSAGYGFAHAVGPGHGKVLLGGAALASRASAWRMAGLAVASSLAQSASAVILVYGGLQVVSVSARWAVGAAEDILAPVSAAAIAAIGALLAWRGARAALATGGGHADAHGTACGHAHGPTPGQVEALSSWREAAVLVASIAIRPCTGAIFLLVIAWRMDLVWTGLAAVVAMGLGTAAFTVAVAVSGVAARGATLFAGTGSARGAALAAPLLQIAAGLAIVLLSAAVLAGFARV